MLVTALKKPLGYDTASKIAKHAHHERLTLRKGAAAFGVTDEEFDAWVRPDQMVRSEDEGGENS